ncbi:TPA: hypothetical protein N0F65_012525 [Lagenidium giganteum]|uniref:Selenoprotein O n=1 Tax=Lagenidium giganteum TaxID=4803 RepID=A0AAV2YMY8_9STRA|nr:TPA: hypothetical protein N0F65_012525 [Lagenidium giganteum]
MTPAPSVAAFDNATLRELPIDAEPRNFVRSAVPGACFSRIAPTPIDAPELVVVSRDALRLVAIDVFKNSKNSTAEQPASDDAGQWLPAEDLETLVPFLAGNQLFEGSETAAQCYCGHQFGFFTGQLGDGAAVYLGEIVQQQPGSNRSERWEMQIKGAGLTPYSRSADGRKVLRSTLREFLASEHMHALGIPTTRAGSVVVSHKTQVLRDMFYDGNAKVEPCAVVLRVARTFIRFGSFEIFKDTDPHSGRRGPSAHVPNKSDMMNQMLNFVIRQYFGDIWEKYDSDRERRRAFFREVVERTARLVAKWQAVGFCHGVLNTDNMSIVGDTLDYGPYGFMKHFNPAHVCNSSDSDGRYRYETQPEICKWNCGVLADQLALVMDRQDLDAGLARFESTYHTEYYRLMREKLGLKHKFFPTEDQQLVDSLFSTMASTGADFTCTFRSLISLQAFGESHDAVVAELVEISESLEQVKQRMTTFTDAQYEMVKMIYTKSPAQASQYGITAATLEHMDRERAARAQLDAMSAADRRQFVHAEWSKWIAAYAKRVREEFETTPDVAGELDRKTRMSRVNPLFVLRNHVAQSAIDFAMEGSYDQVEHIFNLLTHPYDEGSACDRQYALPSTTSLRVSCSS